MHWLQHVFITVATLIATLLGGGHATPTTLAVVPPTVPVTHHSAVAPSSTQETTQLRIQPQLPATTSPTVETTATTSTTTLHAVYFQGQETPFSTSTDSVYAQNSWWKDNSTSTPINDSDPVSFRVIDYFHSEAADYDEWIAKDKFHVYSYSQGEVEEPPGSGGYVYKDFLHLWQGVDPTSFVEVGSSSNFFKDKNHVYYGDGFVVSTANANQFAALGDGYYGDGKSFYNDYGGTTTLPVSDPGTFKVLAYGYAKDKEQVYYNGYPDQSWDASSFMVLSKLYLKDKSRVYYDNHDATGPNVGNITSADPATFVVLPTSAQERTIDPYDEYAKDKNHVYFDRTVVSGADPKTFIAVDQTHGKDANHVYYRENVISGADPATFRVISGDVNMWYGKDSSHVYRGTSTIPAADPATFNVCSLSATSSCELPSGMRYYAYDKNHFYGVYGKLIK